MKKPLERYDYRVWTGVDGEGLALVGSCYASSPEEATHIAMGNYVQTAQDLDEEFNPFNAQV